jgi:hypothetical protein
MRNIILIIASWMIIVSSPLLAREPEMKIKGIVDPALTSIIFHNPKKVPPQTFENDHYAINRCFKIVSGYLTHIESGEGLFEGYELNKNQPSELRGKKLVLVNEVVRNKAGIRLSLSKKEVEKIINRNLPDAETMLSYESVKVIKGIPYYVITTVTIGFENDELVKFIIITSTSS